MGDYDYQLKKKYKTVQSSMKPSQQLYQDQLDESKQKNKSALKTSKILSKVNYEFNSLIIKSTKELKPIKRHDPSLSQVITNLFVQFSQDPSEQHDVLKCVAFQDIFTDQLKSVTIHYYSQRHLFFQKRRIIAFKYHVAQLYCKELKEIKANLVRRYNLRKQKKNQLLDAPQTAEPKSQKFDKKKLQIDLSVVKPKGAATIKLYVNTINQLTENMFEKTKSHMMFPQIEQKIQKSTVLCLLKMKEFQFFNQYDFPNEKNPLLYCWEVIYKNRSLVKTTPNEYPKACKDLVDFVYNRNGVDKVTCIFWKVKNNDEVRDIQILYFLYQRYIGQIEISASDFENSNEVLDYNEKIITQRTITKEMYKVLETTSAYLGSVEINLIQFSAENLPQNKRSGIPGSPRTDEERRRHKLIEDSKSGSYKWSIDEEERIVIEMINEATKNVVVKYTVTEVMDEAGNRILLIEKFDLDSKGMPRNFKVYGRAKKEQLQEIMNILKEIDQNGQVTGANQRVRILSVKGRVTRQQLEVIIFKNQIITLQDALVDSGCDPNQLFLYTKDDMGLALIDFLLITDQMPAVLEAFNKMDLLKENDMTLEEFTTNLFRNIRVHARKNHQLKATCDFVKALQNYPEMGLIISQYLQMPINLISDVIPFLADLDLNNYEHVLLLGQINKLIEKLEVDPDSNFVRQLKVAYRNAKKDSYFMVPCLPKKGDLDAKKDLLILDQMGFSIFHETIRRQRWQIVHRNMKDHGNWFFKSSDPSPTAFEYLLERAPYETLCQILDANIDLLKEQYENKEPYQLKPENKRKAFEYLNEEKDIYRKTEIHSLANNSDYQQSFLLEVLKKLKENCSPEYFSTSLDQRLRAGDQYPLETYLDRLREKCKTKADRIYKDINSIIEIVRLIKGTKIEIPANQFNLCKIMSRFNEDFFDILEKEFEFLQWFPRFEVDSISFNEWAFRLLIKTKKANKIQSIVEKIVKFQKLSSYQSQDEDLVYKDTPFNPEAKIDEGTDESNKIKELFFISRGLLLSIELINESKHKKLEDVKRKIQQKFKNIISMYPQLLVVRNYGQQLQRFVPKNDQQQNFTLLQHAVYIKEISLLYSLKKSDYAQLNQDLVQESMFMIKDKKFFECDIAKEIIKNDPEKQLYSAILGNHRDLVDMAELILHFKRFESLRYGSEQADNDKVGDDDENADNENNDKKKGEDDKYHSICGIIDQLDLLIFTINNPDLYDGFEDSLSYPLKYQKPKKNFIKELMTRIPVTKIFDYLSLVYKQDEEQFKDNAYTIVRSLFDNILQALHSNKATYNKAYGQPLAYYFAFFFKHPKFLQVTDIFSKWFNAFNNKGNKLGQNYCLALLTGKDHQKNTYFQPKTPEVSQVNLKYNLSIHWAIQATTQDFIQIINDISILYRPEDYQNIMIILAVSGMYEKLKILLQIAKSPKYLMAAFLECSRFFYYQTLQSQLYFEYSKSNNALVNSHIIRTLLCQDNDDRPGSSFYNSFKLFDPTVFSGKNQKELLSKQSESQTSFPNHFKNFKSTQVPTSQIWKESDKNPQSYSKCLEILFEQIKKQRPSKDLLDNDLFASYPDELFMYLSVSNISMVLLSQNGEQFFEFYKTLYFEYLKPKYREKVNLDQMVLQLITMILETFENYQPLPIKINENKKAAKGQKQNKTPQESDAQIENVDNQADEGKDEEVEEEQDEESENFNYRSFKQSYLEKHSLKKKLIKQNLDFFLKFINKNLKGSSLLDTKNVEQNKTIVGLVKTIIQNLSKERFDQQYSLKERLSMEIIFALNENYTPKQLDDYNPMEELIPMMKCFSILLARQKTKDKRALKIMQRYIKKNDKIWVEFEQKEGSIYEDIMDENIAKEITLQKGRRRINKVKTVGNKVKLIGLNLRNRDYIAYLVNNDMNWLNINLERMQIYKDAKANYFGQQLFNMDLSHSLLGPKIESYNEAIVENTNQNDIPYLFWLFRQRTKQDLKKSIPSEIIIDQMLVNYVQNYSDEFCSDFIKTILVQQIQNDKELQQKLLEYLISPDCIILQFIIKKRMTKTYKEIYYDLLQKVLLSGKKSLFQEHMTTIFKQEVMFQATPDEGDQENGGEDDQEQKAQSKANKEQVENQPEEADQQEASKKGETKLDLPIKNNMVSLAMIYQFYEIIETVLQLQLNFTYVEIGEPYKNNCINIYHHINNLVYQSLRFSGCTSEQLIQKSAFFGQLGFNYVANGLLLYNQLRQISKEQINKKQIIIQEK